MLRDLPEHQNTERPPHGAAPSLHVQLNDIHKQFGRFTALAGIHLDIRQGEFVSLLGPSGCGKTTLLRILAGLEHADRGQIMLHQRDITRLPPAERDYGIVFQSYALFPNLTVAANIAYGLKGRREDRQRRVDELLDLIGLAGIASKYPAQLSGGQQQRVALARALATSPSLLLLDEPLSALDAQVREHLRHEIKQLQRKLGVTTIMVTHDQEEALTMADRVVVMNHGVIEQIGSPETIYRKPATRFVADFVGQCNWLSGTVLSPGYFRLGNAAIAAHSLAHHPTGRQVEVFLRPEDVILHPRWEAGPNMALGELKQLELLGSQYRMTLQVADWGGITLQADLNHHQLASLNFRDGQRIPVQLPANCLQCFSTEHSE
ncbi:putative 2-aminoethylphosphonate ABC transporter ATP-binding protein [Chitinibacter tainanensis]|uniref:putative 2-aminoethylphosphonate ABC transporter ATP-binding protein n=1 Tax=Chitinibacter tainanensis TaxID=230667 RepID=UPI0004057650|nr:putative 2-aminoethylphosphonate ABC transporter ATP-binding protein [Chitinibacter tainanensis]